MSAKHTPGPWSITRQEDYDGRTKGMFVERIGPFRIEWHADLNKGQPDRVELDIALAAAAPLLLSQLRIAARFIRRERATIFEGVVNQHTKVVDDADDAAYIAIFDKALARIDAAIVKATTERK